MYFIVTAVFDEIFILLYIPFSSKLQSMSFEFRWKWVLWIIDEPENLYFWQSQPRPLPVKFRWMNWEAWAAKCLTRHKNCWRNQNLSVLFIYKSSSFVLRPLKCFLGTLLSYVGLPWQNRNGQPMPEKDSLVRLDWIRDLTLLLYVLCF